MQKNKSDYLPSELKRSLYSEINFQNRLCLLEASQSIRTNLVLTWGYVQTWESKKERERERECVVGKDYSITVKAQASQQVPNSWLETPSNPQ